MEGRNVTQKERRRDIQQLVEDTAMPEEEIIRKVPGSPDKIRNDIDSLVQAKQLYQPPDGGYKST
jgi:DeoR/GlpR family transcriptional regulator of sugar metabolism